MWIHRKYLILFIVRNNVESDYSDVLGNLNIILRECFVHATDDGKR